MEDWKKDGMGCLKLRKKEKAIILIDSLRLVGRDENLLRKVFGKPNEEIIQTNGGKILKYYFDSTCISEGNLDLESDYCSALFYITDSKFSEAGFRCQ
jgi:hypothetical protein